MSQSSAQVRAQLSHPVIDADGHFVEMAPLLHTEMLDNLVDIGGAELRDRYLANPLKPTDTSTILSTRTLSGARESWSSMPSWWGWPSENVLDRATAHIPQLLYDRLDEFGIDFTILYPSMTIGLLDIDDAELGSAVCRAVNRAYARQFAPFADRMTVGALVPMQRPDLASEVLREAVDLGFKSCLISAYARRPIAKLQNKYGSLSPKVYRLDHFGLDSEHDYDPFWQTCVDVRMAPSVHSSVQYHDLSRSVSNYVYNHIDGIGKSHEALAKSLFLGGVTHRFPTLRFGFLEGGVGWAAGLYASLLGHWEKRNARDVMQFDPDRLDVDRLMSLVQSHGDADMVREAEALRAWFGAPAARPAQLDDFAAAHLSSATDLRDKFVPNFYFGCEADDPLVAWAFNGRVNPHGAQLRAVFGSDISHWDVPDMSDTVAEAWELVEHGTIDEAGFRDFVFTNPVRLHAAMNPDYFTGTVVEQAVASAIAKGEDR
jgi:predicted TIM-barrel fold metal-dependent hydrolase